MNSIKIAFVAILTIGLLQLVNAQVFPADGPYQSIDPPANIEMPDHGQSVTDYSVSTPISITRVTEPLLNADGDIVWYPTNSYAKYQVWNADQTMYKIRSWKVYDANTFEEVRELSSMYTSHWSNTNPDLIWAFLQNGTVKKYLVSTGIAETVATIKNANGEAYQYVMLGPGEGNFDKNDKYVAFACKDGQDMDVVVFDMENLQVLTRKKFVGCWQDGSQDFPYYVDWVSASQSGDYVTIMWHHERATDDGVHEYKDQDNILHYGVEVYNTQTMQFLHRIARYGNHGDFGYAVNGKEVFVQFYGVGTINMYNLDGTGATVLSTEDDFYNSGHLSCRNINRPGWAYLTISSGTQTGQMVAIKLDESNTVEHFGHHFSSAQSYAQASMGVASPNGDLVCFKSDFGTSPNDGDVAYVFFAKVANPLSVDKTTPLMTSIYPNPTHGLINIQSDDNIEKVMIFNQLGQLSFSATNTNKLDISHLPKGPYTLKIQSKSGLSQQLIILK